MPMQWLNYFILGFNILSSLPKDTMRIPHNQTRALDVVVVCRKIRSARLGTTRAVRLQSLSFDGYTMVDPVCWHCLSLPLTGNSSLKRVGLQRPYLRLSRVRRDEPHAGIGGKDRRADLQR